MKIKPVFFIVVVLLSIFLSGCSFVEVFNSSEVGARVIVTVPGSSGGSSKFVQPQESADFFSSTSGVYTIQVLIDKSYTDLVVNLRNELSDRIWNQRETLTGNEIAHLIERINGLNKELNTLANLGASCQGNLPEDETVVVVLSWDKESWNWILSCP